MGNPELYEAPRGPFVEIAKAGRAYAQIVTAAQPTRLEQFAASELQAYLHRISGARLPLLREDEAPQGVYSFLIGGTRKAAAAHIASSERAMGRDGFALRSARNGLIVVGRNDLGTVFGVYELLERCFDVRWFMPGELGEHVPRRDTLQLGKINLVFKPSFRVRAVGSGDWSLKQRMNVHVTADNKPAGVNWKWHFHTFNILIPPARYGAERPEFFAMVKGRRDVARKSPQLCTSNPELVRELAANLIQALDEEAGIEIIALSPEDHEDLCECEKCRALDEPGQDWFGKNSRRLAIFNSDVARLVKAKHPNVRIKIGAYTTYARPPLDAERRPSENTIVQLCHAYFCHSHPLVGGCRAGETYAPHAEFQPNSEFCRILDQWIELTPHVFIYEYYWLNGIHLAKLPWPLVHTMRLDIPYYRARGVEGFYSQLRDDTWHRCGLNYYVAAKLCWNADLNVDALLDDYFEKFFGPAAGHMRNYFLTMEKAMQDWNGCASYGLVGWERLGKVIGPSIFTPPVMARMGESIEQAERLAAGDEMFSRRVAMARRMYAETQESLAAIRNGGS